MVNPIFTEFSILMVNMMLEFVQSLSFYPLSHYPPSPSYQTPPFSNNYDMNLHHFKRRRLTVFLMLFLEKMSDPGAGTVLVGWW
jgi:hypothetical protein